MNGRLNLGIVALATAALFAAPAAPTGATPELEAQESMGRFRVLVPRFFPQQGADDNFGEDAAKRFREMLNELPTHQPISEDEIEDALDKFDMDWEDLDCIKTRQLASQINAQVALCAGYTEQGDQASLQAIQFWDMGSSESLDVEAVTVPRRNNGDRQAAQHIFTAFDEYVQLVRFQQFCAEYAQSQQWENALRNCDQALELNPGATQTRYRKARILYEQANALEEGTQERQQLFRQGYEELQEVLEANEFHEEALQLAGYLAIQLDEQEAGREYYSKYLEINPNADAVRIKVAYDVAQAGDPLGAAQLVKVGLDQNPENPELLEYFGSYMFSAAQDQAQLAVVGTGQDDTSLPPEVTQMYRDAITAFEKAYAVRGAEMAVGHLRNIIAAYMQLGELDRASATAEEVLRTHPEEAAIWAVHADALQRQGNLDGAIEALDRVAEIDPDYPNLAIRQGNWLLQAGRAADALPYFQRAVQNGQDPNTVARLIFADAHSNGVRKENFDYAIRGITTAKQFEINAQTKAELDFWHAWSLLQSAIKIQEPQTVETARRTKPMFEQALRLFQASKSYADAQASINYGQMTQAATTYIEIQDAILKRAGGL